jgi:hypothetical protein
MNDDDCKRYVADPEGQAEHLETCERCRALFGDLEFAHGALPPLALPLAPWEGASYRSWALVAAAGAIVVAIVCSLFFAAGLSPLAGLAAAIRTAFPSIEMVQTLVFRLSGALRQVPALWQAALGLAFVAVNTLLFFLLRRAPKGLDV